jgi:DNA-binding XRE family transcriptional regulator
MAVGYSRNTIAMLETARLDPVLSHALALADYFRVPLAQLLDDGRPLSRGQSR